MSSDTPNEPLPKLRGDFAKRSINDDDFGLDEMARIIAKAVCSRVPDEGYAIGIEGRWGSGKTTLLNFVQEVLDPQKATVSVIRFEPWLVGKNEGLLREFFQLISNALLVLQGDAKIRERFKRKNLIDRLVVNLARYSNYLDTGTQIATAAAVLDPTWFSKIFLVVSRTVSALANLSVNALPSIITLKAEIAADLQRVANLITGFRIVVIIDDCDRLEPSESVEILRLIKSVANFPMVTYLVGFDREILSKHVMADLRVDGTSYIEKIFQQVLSLPPQEPFALQKCLRSSLARDFPKEFEQSAKDDWDRSVRSDAVFDTWASKLLETPRDVILLCEAVRFGWPYIQERADFLDYLWLQLIKLKCDKLYTWARGYTANLGAYGDGGRPSDGDAEASASVLKAELDRLGWGERSYRSFIGDILPGLSDFDAGGKQTAVFKFEHADELDRWELHRRLGSPSHWRYYFALTKPSYALDDAEITSFLELVGRDWHAATESLQAFYDRSHLKNGFHLEVLIDRIVGRKLTLSSQEVLGLAWAFSEKMDQYPPDPLQFADSSIWRGAIKCLSTSISPNFPEIVRTGKSLNWLAFVLRDQGFALGRTGNNPVERRIWIEGTDFDQSINEIVARFRRVGIQGLVALPAPLQALFCWQQLGDSNEVRNLIAAYSASDETFLAVVRVMGGWSVSSKDGRSYKLETGVIREFMEPRETHSRLQKIAISENSKLSRDANLLLENWTVDSSAIPY